MSVEMSYLAMYGLFVVILILAQVLISARQHSLAALLGNREGLVSTGIAERSERAVQNSLLALALVTPAVLMIAQAGMSTASSEMAMRIFLTARIAYAICFILGITYIRTIIWTVGFLATASLYYTLL